MRALFDMATLIRSSLAEYVRQPDLLMLVAIVVILVYGQYARIAHIETRLFGAAQHPPWDQTLHSMISGLAGGIFASLLFVWVGVPLSGVGIGYIWIVALVLALFHPRFLCFSYAGGLLALVHLIWGIPGLSVPAIAALVATLHLVESVLIVSTGAKGATPVYARYHDGRVVGGFLLQRFWPIPFAALVTGLVVPDMVSMAQDIAMPSWWPLIQPQLPMGPEHQLIYSTVPVIAALGYSDLALTRQPAERSKSTAGMLLLYSIILLILAAASQYGTPWAWAAALFAPLGHEGVIAWGRRQELRGKPVFRPEQGAMVMDVVSNTPAEQMGLQTGDVILAVNGEPIASKAQLAESLAPWVIGVSMEVENVLTGRRQTLYYQGKIPPLGAVLAPGPDEPYLIDPYQSQGLIYRFMQRMYRKGRGRRT